MYDAKRLGGGRTCVLRRVSGVGRHSARGNLLGVSPKLSFDPIAEARRQWNRHWGRAATPSMGAVTSIMRVHQVLMARLNELLEPYGLTFPRYEALMLLFYSQRGSLPLGKMGDRLQVHRTSVTNTIDGLERLGYVERLPHDQDRRTTLASITARGREVARLATEALNEERFGTAPLERGDLERLSEILQRVRIDAGDFDDGVSGPSRER
jgi:DNA-binding MarR family transcriptional regulator